MQDTTLCLFINDGKILLGMKKRRFGAGKKVEGRFDFINEGAQIDDFDIREV